MLKELNLDFANLDDFATVTPGPQIVTTIIPVGPRATHMVCPHCHAEILSETRSTPGKILS